MGLHRVQALSNYGYRNISAKGTAEEAIEIDREPVGTYEAVNDHE
jgi:hypothetical protein